MGTSIRKIEYIVGVVVLIVLVVSIGKFYYPVLLNQYNGVDTKISRTLDAWFGKCEPQQVRISLSDGYICREEATPSDYLSIFDAYPRYANGREAVYSFMEEGDIDTANKLLVDTYAMPRSEDIVLPSLTWTEDPYNDQFWRFNFYSLRFLNDLLYAAEKTENEAYTKKLIEITTNFIDQGMTQPAVWDDKHAVAFRAMSITNVWWGLREQNALTAELSEKLLVALDQHGDFLQNPKNYEANYNHGLNQSVALFSLATNFPALDSTGEWMATSKERLNETLELLIDEDGALIENSPYYHFYALDKYWDLYRYSKREGIVIHENFENKIRQMIAYATYILEPNRSMPLLGASLEWQINNAGNFREMGDFDPNFKYVLTGGEEGKKPDVINKFFTDTGQAIFRSGWDAKRFSQQTQLIFDVGAYRTFHSDRDALSLVLFGNGRELLTDAGLFTYEHGEMEDYFDGTYAHNTVVVDGKSQRTGYAYADTIYESEGIVIQSAKHTLYPGVVHYRTMALVEEDTVIIFDRLVSSENHSYEQNFILAPGAMVENVGTATLAKWEDGTTLTIEQLISDKITTKDITDGHDPIRGLCSKEYGISIPCHNLSYDKHGNSVDYVTTLKIGPGNDHQIQIDDLKREIVIETDKRKHILQLDWSGEHPVSSTDITSNRTTSSISLSMKNGLWIAETALAPLNINGFLGFEHKNGKVFDLNIPKVGTYPSTHNRVVTDIPYSFAGGSFVIQEQEDYLPIFGYHAILDDDEEITAPDTQIHLRDFKKQVEFATNSLGCQWHTFSDIMENYVFKSVKTLKNACVMTFDDGFQNNYTNALPVLDELGIKATFYIVPGRLEHPRQMTWKQVDELYLKGHEIGSHTVDSGGLISAQWNREQLIHQIEDSKQMLEDQGYRITTFAYPLGEWNEEILSIVKESYIAGRDISKPRSWADRRTPTVGVNDDFIWHMHYIHPEKLNEQEMRKKLGYSSWWQFEEDYTVVADHDADVQVLSSMKPTETSYGSLSLPDAGDSIEKEFVTSLDSQYNIKILASVRADDPSLFGVIAVDGISVPFVSQPIDQCMFLGQRHFCFVDANIQLKAGQHTITVTNGSPGLLLDKMQLERSVTLPSTIDVQLTEYENGRVNQNLLDNQYIQVSAQVVEKPSWWSRILKTFLGLFGIGK